ncbi:hypothetical protein BVG16_16250 [Paenibacillus selenitireducens]|uniref:Replication protein n=1 Tax=Paenibacillus selenitireducens TaxID=1324314 RepID=A0A1T2XA05_9BACL|nr:hypothetical protein [Paenibacillus selenitireducens]OPA76721.1 hypothetical protein BVG16_16250 [Paenibacillus selenitireducens]
MSTPKVVIQLAEKRSRNELTLPIQHFIAMDDWIDKLGKQAYIAWLKLYTYADRTEEQRFNASLTKLCTRLDVSKGTFYSKVVPQLWDYGFIDFKECDGFLTIIVYSYPQNKIELASKPLNKIRDYATEWETENRERAKSGGRKPGQSTGSIGSENEPSVINGSKIEPKTSSKIEPNNISKSLNNSNNLNDCMGDADASAEHSEIYQALQKHAKKNCYVLDNTPIGTWYIDEMYTMLINQFSNQLDPQVVQLATELYFERASAITVNGVVMKLQLDNPVGYFQWCYKDAIKQFKARRNKIA